MTKRKEHPLIRHNQSLSTMISVILTSGHWNDRLEEAVRTAADGGGRHVVRVCVEGAVFSCVSTVSSGVAKFASVGAQDRAPTISIAVLQSM